MSKREIIKNKYDSKLDSKFEFFSLWRLQSDIVILKLTQKAINYIMN